MTTMIIGGVVLFVVILAARHTIRSRKDGGCGCGCEGCNRDCGHRQ